MTKDEKTKLLWLFIPFLILYIGLGLLYYKIEKHMEKVEQVLEYVNAKQAQLSNDHIP